MEYSRHYAYLGGFDTVVRRFLSLPRVMTTLKDPGYSFVLRGNYCNVPSLRPRVLLVSSRVRMALFAMRRVRFERFVPTCRVPPVIS